jgi:hypothetical protein
MRQRVLAGEHSPLRQYGLSACPLNVSAAQGTVRCRASHSPHNDVFRHSHTRGVATQFGAWRAQPRRCACGIP